MSHKKSLRKAERASSSCIEITYELNAGKASLEDRLMESSIEVSFNYLRMLRDVLKSSKCFQKGNVNRNKLAKENLCQEKRYHKSSTFLVHLVKITPEVDLHSSLAASNQVEGPYDSEIEFVDEKFLIFKNKGNV